MHFVTKAKKGNPSWSKLPVLCCRVTLSYPGCSVDDSFHLPEESILSPLHELSPHGCKFLRWSHFARDSWADETQKVRSFMDLEFFWEETQNNSNLSSEEFSVWRSSK